VFPLHYIADFVASRSKDPVLFSFTCVITFKLTQQRTDGQLARRTDGRLTIAINWMSLLISHFSDKRLHHSHSHYSHVTVP